MTGKGGEPVEVIGKERIDIVERLLAIELEARIVRSAADG